MGWSKRVKERKSFFQKKTLHYSSTRLSTFPASSTLYPQTFSTLSTITAQLIHIIHIPNSTYPHLFFTSHSHLTHYLSPNYPQTVDKTYVPNKKTSNGRFHSRCNLIKTVPDPIRDLHSYPVRHASLVQTGWFLQRQSWPHYPYTRIGAGR